MLYVINNGAAGSYCFFRNEVYLIVVLTHNQSGRRQLNLFCVVVFFSQSFAGVVATTEASIITPTQGFAFF